MSYPDPRIQPGSLPPGRLILALAALVAGLIGPGTARAIPDSDGASPQRLEIEALHEQLDWKLKTASGDVDVEDAEPMRLLRLRNGMRTFLDEEHPPSPSPGRRYPEDWGSYSLLLRLEQEEIGDAQELERGFTYPQFLSLSTLDYLIDMPGGGFLDLNLRNITDQEPRVTLAVENAAKTRLDLDFFRSRIRDLPSTIRTVRHEAGARVSFVQDVGLRLPFSLEVDTMPVWLSYRQRKQEGEGARGRRDWDFASYEVGTSLDAGLFRMDLALPFSHFSDNLDGINSNSHYGGRFRIVGRYRNLRASLGAQLQRFEIGQRPDPETRLVVDLNLVNPRVYGIKGLTNRSRMSIIRRWDELALTGRVKSGYEGHSRLTYQPQKRFRNFRFESGTHTRRSHHRRLLRAGIDSIPTIIDPASRLELDFLTEETASTMTEGWMSVTYRGFPGVRLHAGFEGATLTNPPPTDFGGIGSNTLYFDRRDGVFLDVSVDTDNPVWGFTYKGKAQNRLNSERDTAHVWQQHAFIGHVMPHPRVTLTGGFTYTGFETTSDAVAEGQTNTTSLSSAIHYVFSDRSALFADVQASTSSGRFAGTETLLNAGFEARSREGGDDSYRLIYTSARLGSRSDLLVPYKQHMITLMRTQRF